MRIEDKLKGMGISRISAPAPITAPITARCDRSAGWETF
jgi:hypothetical protein